MESTSVQLSQGPVLASALAGLGSAHVPPHHCRLIAARRARLASCKAQRLSHKWGGIGSSSKIGMSHGTCRSSSTVE
eukprot:1727926-Rhodomonas_salina.1